MINHSIDAKAERSAFHAGDLIPTWRVLAIATSATSGVMAQATRVVPQALKMKGTHGEKWLWVFTVTLALLAIVAAINAWRESKAPLVAVAAVAISIIAIALVIGWSALGAIALGLIILLLIVATFAGI